MTLQLKRRLLAVTLAAALAAGCGPAIVDRPTPEDEEQGTEPPRSQPMNSPAVVELSSQAQQALDADRHDAAVQLLERAIRIEPRNGALWHQLARVRFQQGSYEQAMQLANRSNALLADDSTLRTRNDELIDAAREARSY